MRIRGSAVLDLSESAVGLIPPARNAAQSPRLLTHTKMLYHAIAQRGHVGRHEVHSLTMLPSASSIAALRELEDLDLVRETTAGLVAVPVSQVIDGLVSTQTALLASTLHQLREVQRRIDLITAERDALAMDLIERVRAEPSHDNHDFGNLPSQPTSDISAIHPGCQFNPELLEQSLARAAARLREGVRLRVVHQTSALTQPGVVAYLHTIEELGGRVRLRHHLPFRLMIIDGGHALCSFSRRERHRRPSCSAATG